MIQLISTLKQLNKIKCLNKYQFSARTIFSTNMNIKTFVFFDCETTGIPGLENYKTRITELCLTVVQAEHLSLGVSPRVKDKLNMCFNPEKLISPHVSEMTGLWNDLLEHQAPFQSQTVETIKNFLNLQRKPVCFVAHNGNRFDYPILRFEINKTDNELPEDILCIDSLTAFRELHNDFMSQIYQDTNNSPMEVNELNSTEPQPSTNIPFEFNDGYDELLYNITVEVENSYKNDSEKKVNEIQKNNETTPQKNIIKFGSFDMVQSNDKKTIRCRSVHTIPARKKLNFGSVSFKLVDVFTRLTGKTVTDSHHAECDVDMMIECAMVLGQKFIDWANFNAIQFCNIPMMKCGKKLGS